MPKTSHKAKYSLPHQHKNPPEQPEKEILRNASHCHWEIPEDFPLPDCTCGEKKASQRSCKTHVTDSDTQPSECNGSSSAEAQPPNTCTVPPRGRAAVAWLSLTLPAPLNQPLCRQISFTATAKEAFQGCLTSSEPLISTGPVLPSPWSSPVSTREQQLCFKRKPQTCSDQLSR